MSQRLRWAVFFSAIVLVAVIFVGVAVAAGRARARAQRLPDGSILSLEAVTYGQQHQIVRGTWWQKLLNPILTNPARNQFAMMFPRYQSAGSDTLGIWTLRDIPSRNRLRGSLPSWEARGVVFDDMGNAAETTVRVIGAGAGYGAPVLETWDLSAFPRRGEHVGLRLYTRPPGGDWRPAAEFVVPNPDPGPHPAWQPSPLPITVRQGDTAFTLTRLRTGLDETGSADPPSAVETWTEATFRVTEKGKPSTAWEPVDLVISDATGNTWKPPVCLHEWRDGEARLFFRSALWQSERAWKLKVEFMPADSGDSSALWTVAGASVPPPGLFARSVTRAVRNGVALRLQGIAGEGSRAPVPVGIQSSPELPTVHVRLSPPPRGMRLALVRATDEQGRPCALSRPHGGFIGHYSFRLRPPTGAKTLALAFAVPRKSRAVEFVAAPGTGGAARKGIMKGRTGWPGAGE
jgi:hypothetical protein